MSRYLWKTG